MKIYVDKKPKSVWDCPFTDFEDDGVINCKLEKDKCCSLWNSDECEMLIELKENPNENKF